ncbi:trichohyalin-like [Patiria miniata]|uniref:Coiled-coil domain-containing protein 15 n=1 Tax=Patiria miniata TaxID=46514 RepID=A0A914APK6_PATMI|nr:trichohyalin-like [Patiria miniata]
MQPASGFYRKSQTNLARRPAKVVPVGAWVELESQNSRVKCGAVVSAEQEEQRILQAQAEKHAKLERFRRDVKQRVRQLQLVKQQELLNESFHAVELQSNVVQQSSHAAERSTPKKDRCLYRHDNEALAIGHSSDNVTSGSESEAEVAVRVDGGQLTERSHRVHRIVSQAKRSLAAKQMCQPQANLPGGTWGSQYSRDRQIHDPVNADESGSKQHVNDIESETTDSDTRIPQQTIDELSSYGEGENRPPSGSHDPDALRRLAGVPAPKTVTFSGDLGRARGRGVTGQGESARCSVKTRAQGDLCDKYANDMQMRSEVRPKPNRREKEHVKMSRTVPELHPGVLKEENKRRVGNQYSMYRRLFMDIEREQVRENIRKKEHQKNIQSLKEEKERDRRRAEADAHQRVEPRNHLTGETEEEVLQRQREEQQQMEQVMQRERNKRQKSTEISRYIRALKAMMREKIEQMGLEVPPLCACGPSVWDANPETCANNCLFYKNPKAYAKALHTLLVSCDLS